VSKSVLGDDPFAAGGTTIDEPGPKQAKKATAKKATAKKATAKKATAKKATAKKAAAKKAAAKKAPAKKAPAKKAPAKKAPAKKATVRKAASPPRPPLPTVDGASARRASKATATLGEAPAPAEAAQVTGAGLDPEASVSTPNTSLAGELRRIEQHVVQRLSGSPVKSADKQVSLLDRIGQLLDAETYRGWLSGLMMRNRSDRVDDFGLDPVYAENWRPLLDFLYQSYWRVETSGLENLPDNGRALIVANHSGTLPYDGAMLMFAVRYNHPAHRDIRPLVEDFVFHFPFIGVALNRIGCVRACQENAERLLANEQVVAVFPEGIKGIGKLYRRRYQLQRFGRGGFVQLALKTRSPIIPAAVVGAEEVHPMLAKVTWLAKYLGIPYIPITPTFPWLGAAGAIPIPSKWSIRFGEPMDLAGQYGPDAHHDRILVNRLTEQVRSTIQTMVDESLLGRRSVIFG
jgi:1-acyl-sn-glycerol-3-phosphate acyltransferase